jgi:site-specific recombinase XerC
MEPFAVLAIQRWLALRNPSATSELVFLASRQGGGMHPTSVFRRIKLVMLAAGLEESDRTCCQTLRNSYAATLFDRDTPLAAVADLMGFEDPVTALRLRVAYQGEEAEGNEVAIDQVGP